jgi:fatty-acyl-CoA synthase
MRNEGREGHVSGHDEDKLNPVGAVRRPRTFRAMELDEASQASRGAANGGVAFASTPGTAPTPIRHPDRPAVIDELGTLTYAELDARANALARSVAAAGIEEGDRVAIMCRNNRGFIEATLASTKLGADALYLSIELAKPAVSRVLDRERPAAFLCDEEFSDLAGEDDVRAPRRFVVYSETERALADALLGESAPPASATPLPPPSDLGHTIILTSGTTGTPKAAVRGRPAPGSQASSAAAPIVSRIPLRPLETTMIAAPLHHLWGYSQLMLGLPLASTYVLRGRFDAEDTLRAIAEHQVSVLVIVPLMLQRMLRLDPATRARYDTSCLRVIAVSGSALPGDLALKAMDAFGDVLYNLYGTTETGAVAIATPRDLREAPGTAGRPPAGTEVRLLDKDGRVVGRGEHGRIFVKSGYMFQGYTSGEGREAIDGLLSTGDFGHLDEEGRLFVDGREDDMVISGSENVYPREVEDLLARHEQIVEAAVVGVPDQEFGERLKAFVVRRDGCPLSEQLVKDFVKASLARYKVPREVVFLTELPRNAAGKVLKRELADLG